MWLHNRPGASMSRLCLVLFLMLLPGPLHAQAGPAFSATGPDADRYGAAQQYPVGGVSMPDQAHMIGFYSHLDRILPFHRVSRAATPSPLRRAPRDFALSYRLRGVRHTLAGYLARTHVTGLLIAHNDTILFEHYQYARTDQDRLTSQSMAKTVVALLIGIAIHEGRIRSVDDLAQAYVPELAGTAFGQTNLRALLHMASGIAYSDDDPAGGKRLARALFLGIRGSAADVIASYATRDHPPGTHFQYGGAQTEVLAMVLSHVTGMPLAAYLESRIWRPMGAEADATWIVDRAGQEVAYCCINAVLRDWARLGLILARDGKAADGQQLVPGAWLRDATTALPGSPFAPGHASDYFGYGYQIWLFPGPRRQFALLGIHGQSVFVDQAARLVMVQTAVQASDNRAEAVALWSALTQRFGDGPAQRAAE
jgi:CubicO group peptidase (beta-lactamase class C family)